MLDCSVPNLYSLHVILAGFSLSSFTGLWESLITYPTRKTTYFVHVVMVVLVHEVETC